MTRLARPLAALVGGVALGMSGLLVLAAPAHAAPDVGAAAQAFRGGESVYNDPDAEKALSDGQAADLSDQIAASRLPIFIAVLPESAAGGGSADDTLVALKDQTGLGGVYAVVVGNQFRAGATKGSVADIATNAFRDHKAEGVDAVLTNFVSGVDAYYNGGSSSEVSGSSSGGMSAGSIGILVLFLVLIVLFVALIIFGVTRRRRAERKQVAAIRGAIEEDVTDYGQKVSAIASSSADDDATRADLQTALDSYESAKKAAATMATTNDVAVVTGALEQGRYALACVDARRAGKPVPERRAPCFVDPRHGPSVADIMWAPAGLPERDVPVCATCERTIQQGGTPQGLQVSTTSGMQPYWQVPAYAPYALGYYSPFGNAMTGVLVGTAIGSMWSHPYYGGYIQMGGMGGGSGWSSSSGGWGGSGFSSSGGDFGGGGFGGGDFGGGGGGGGGGGDF